MNTYTKYHGSLNNASNRLRCAAERPADIVDACHIATDEVYMRSKGLEVVQHALRGWIIMATPGENHQVLGAVPSHVDGETSAKSLQTTSNEIRDVLFQLEGLDDWFNLPLVRFATTGGYSSQRVHTGTIVESLLTSVMTILPKCLPSRIYRNASTMLSKVNVLQIWSGVIWRSLANLIVSANSLDRLDVL